MARASDGIRDGRQRRRGKTDVWEASYCVLVSINEEEDDDDDDSDEEEDDGDEYYQVVVVDNDDDVDYQVDDMIIIVVMFVFLACFRSQTIRKNAVQLISGLDISKQIRLVCCHRHLFTQHHS